MVCRPMMREVMARMDSLNLYSEPKCLENHSRNMKNIMANPTINKIAPKTMPRSKLKRRLKKSVNPSYRIKPCLMA
jgi:hypothetical protein